MDIPVSRVLYGRVGHDSHIRRIGCDQLSWVPGSQKPDQHSVSASLWYWQLQSRAYPGLCEVDGDLYWLDPKWQDVVEEYCRGLT